MSARITAAVVATVVPALANVSVPSAADVLAPSLVDHVEWAHYTGLSSLRVYPTPLGRAASRQPDAGAGSDSAGERAWREVLAGAPDADTPGMRAQFLCHWRFAEFAQPGKLSWNLEPWRPVVDDATMVDAGCNPGAAEEPW